MSTYTEIPLSKGFSAIVDAVDSDLLQLKWHVITPGYNKYARNHSNGKYILMHRLILERKIGRALTNEERPDHIDGNGLNNTRDNLRLATSSQNQSNRKEPAHNTTGFKGVSKRRGKWFARIVIGGKLIWLGTYNTPEEAHKAYKQAAMKYYGEFANFGSVNEGE